jgi:membrane associated rhomboid family serine protease
MIKDYGITKYIGCGRKNPIGILTYWLGHLGWGHLIWNLLIFVLTAPAYISCIGRKKFFIYSAINIVLGGIIFLAYKYNSDIWIIGFSGIAYMTLIGYVLLSKNIFAIIIGIILTLKVILFCFNSLITQTYFNGDIVHLLGIILGIISVKRFINEQKKEIINTV